MVFSEIVGGMKLPIFASIIRKRCAEHHLP
jgi:hypothetical protein